jgi:hypothetical protein
MSDRKTSAADIWTTQEEDLAAQASGGPEGADDPSAGRQEIGDGGSPSDLSEASPDLGEAQSGALGEIWGPDEGALEARGGALGTSGKDPFSSSSWGRRFRSTAAFVLVLGVLAFLGFAWYRSYQEANRQQGAVGAFSPGSTVHTLTPQPSPSPTAAPSTVAPTPVLTTVSPPPPTPPAELLEATILVRNGTGTSGLAARTSDMLAADGFTLITPTNADETDETTVYFIPSLEDGARYLVSQYFEAARLLPANEAQATEYDIVIILGKDYVEPGR